MRNRIIRTLVIGAVSLGTFAPLTRAADPENCLLCHRYRGLARVDDQEDVIDLYYVDPDYYDRELGPHARLKCTDCHIRSEVEIIPHKPTSKVNCTSSCHLVQPGSVELTFSHGNIHNALQTSAHTIKVLTESNKLLGDPLGPDQARCLLCHDEPTFYREGENWVNEIAPVRRCRTCHKGDLEIDTRFAYWHVESRSRPAWSNENLTRVCAVCHSNEAIRKVYNLPNTTASYLASFHGKAALLGNQATAGCIDCHVNPLDNTHAILKITNPKASTYPTRVANTCRSASCHATADVSISTAAVHLDLATSSGIEYFIAALFIVLILATFGPSVVLQTLELFQIVIGRQDPRQHAREELARRLMRTYEGRMALTRFTVHQRVQHWVLVVCFAILVITGFPIKFADHPWASTLIHFIGGLTFARHLHHYAGAVLIAGLVYHLIYIFVTAWKTRKRTGQSWFRTLRELPMLTNVEEIRHLMQHIAFLLFIRKERPDGDRFTLKEKFEYFGVFWGTVLLGVTGTLMWFNAWTTVHLTGRVLTVALIIHSFEAFLALLHVGVIHLIGVIFSPVSFPMSPAMFNGETPIEEMAETHAGMIEQAAARVLPGQKGGEQDA